MIQATNLSKNFGPVRAVSDVTLAVDPGEIVCLLGANGAGKTTTVNLCLGFLKPDGGSVRIGGIAPADDPRAARRCIAYIPENVALYPSLTGVENLRLFDRMARGRQSVDFEQALQAHGLTRDQARRPTSGYSKGMRQKVGLAIASIRKAQALLLDEPMSGLDPKAASEFTQSLTAQRDAGTAVLMTTHDIFRAKEVASRIGIMRAGKLVDLLDAARVDAREIERIYLEHMHAEAPTASPSAAAVPQP